MDLADMRFSRVYRYSLARLAQLDRALPSGGRGHRFESCSVYQSRFVRSVCEHVPKSLAEIVIEAGLVPRGEVVRAAQRSDERGVPLIVVLVRELGVDELALVAALRRYTRVVSSDPGSVKQDPDALRELSRDVCRRLRVLPLSLAVFDAGPRVLQLAMADPTDRVALAEVEHLTGCEVQPTLLPLSAVEEMVEHVYRAFVTEVIRRERKPFGEGLTVKTERLARFEPKNPETSTVPYHRVSDEASLELRHSALLELLVDKGVITEDEYEASVRQMMKRREDDS